MRQMQLLKSTRSAAAGAAAIGLVALTAAQPASAKVVTGSQLNDILRGTSSADLISGRAGHDQIYGRAGADRLLGGTGRDRLSGGRGNDRIAGNAGADRVYCGPGRDVVVADRQDVIARDCERVRVSQPTPPSGGSNPPATTPPATTPPATTPPATTPPATTPPVTTSPPVQLPAKLVAERTDSGAPGFKTCHGMQSKATLYKDINLLSAVTDIWSHCWFGGFTGTVAVALLDSDGDVLEYIAPGDSWGVVGTGETWLGGFSDRTIPWQGSANRPQVFPLAASLAILHTHAPRNRLFNVLDEAIAKGQTIAQVVALIAALP
jgi:hypothetical protein